MSETRPEARAARYFRWLVESNNVLGFPLNVRQLAVLVLLQAEHPGSLGIRELTRLLNVAKPCVTRAVDALEDLELAQRRVNRTDSRLVDVTLTARGRRLAEEIAERMK